MKVTVAASVMSQFIASLLLFLDLFCLTEAKGSRVNLVIFLEESSMKNPFLQFIVFI